MRRKKTLGCGKRVENNWINGWNERQAGGKVISEDGCDGKKRWAVGGERRITGLTVGTKGKAERENRVAITTKKL